MTLRILVVSEVRVVQEGVGALLARGDAIDVVGAVDMLHAREQAEQLRADVVLVDAARHDSVEFVKGLVASSPRTKVVAFGVKETDEEILALAAAGTAGYIRASAESADVVSVLRQVLSDELPCSPRAAASLYRHVAMLSQGGVTELAPEGQRAGTSALPLSRRELQIAHLIDRGLSNKEIARQLGIEAATVKNHVHHLCEKLEVHRRSEATARIRALLRARTVTRARADREHPSSPLIARV
jgi:two-component system, NarL family, nitrate/nitrite response regulator NarL